MSYGLLLAGPLGMALLAAAAIYTVVRARREEALLDADAVAVAQPVSWSSSSSSSTLCGTGCSRRTVPPILYGDAHGTLRCGPPEMAVFSPLESTGGDVANSLAGGGQVRRSQGEEPLQVFEKGKGSAGEGKLLELHEQVRGSHGEEPQQVFEKAKGSAGEGKLLEVHEQVRGSHEEEPQQVFEKAKGSAGEGKLLEVREQVRGPEDEKPREQMGKSKEENSIRAHAEVGVAEKGKHVDGREDVGIADEGKLRGSEEVRGGEEEKSLRASKVAGGWHRARCYVQESISKTTEWRHNQRALRIAVDIADAGLCYYLRGSHVLRACCGTLKREVKDWQQQQQQQASPSAPKCGKEATELRTQIDHVRTQMDEIKLQNKELLDKIRSLSTSKIAEWARASWDLTVSCASYLLRGCQFVLQALYGILKRKVNERPLPPMKPNTTAKNGKKAGPPQRGDSATEEEVRLLRKEIEQMREQIGEMKQLNRELLEQLTKVRPEGTATVPPPPLLNPPELSVVPLPAC